ncbi:SDR family NAD(P)-dependent oxidoreductase [Coleofasciculus sp.]|uniref:SDR family NAD(P)-dependent oxidoreductase n=1 Tax=Coleofasciculus sp. TaxID=3100458 RepID=UPI003A195301
MTHHPLESIHTPEKEPIAIIGIGCRFPGNANDPESFWNLLRDGVDAITEVPEDRWNLRTFYDPDRQKPGKLYTRWGGFIERIDQFDAEFFGISPREAALIDPQQRLLLEVTWEALEDAGQVPERLAGSNTGVFVGLYIHDYQHIQLDSSARHLIGAQMTTGTAMSIAANRISYVFDFHGPSMALDTACSSSLVAVHLACQSIWNGESTLAVAGGVNAILKPDMTIGMSKASMLSPDGHCKSFDAAANGFARGEGSGIAILKPLSQAIVDQDPIYAVIRGSAVNQDGHTNGITVPNGQAQEAAIRTACQQAGVSPEQIQYVEAHGTGTAVGDPIEANALGAVLGRNRPAGNHCVIGSVKSNIGHLESAAGITGLIKTVLALKHRQIPPNLHFHTPNPKIPFEELQLRVPQTLEPWPENGNGRRLAGVNSFGFGGTNAHVVLEAIDTYLGTSLPQPSDAQTQENASTQARSLLLPLSARCAEALPAVARVTRDFLTTPDSSSHVSLQDICYTASLRRGHHDHRLTLVADSKQKLAEHLEAFLAGETRLGMSSARLVPGQSPQLAFVFSGMGPQWWAMGRQLLEQEPIFQQTVQRCDSLLRHYTPWSLCKELTAPEEQSRINETQIAQPAIFAVQVGLAALWRSWGITPDAIVGHSVGEVAAAHVAGVLTLEDAIRIIFQRSRIQAKAAGQGKMLAVGLSSQEAEHLLAGYTEKVSIAAINSPNALTLAGDSAALENIAQSLEQKQVFCRFLKVEVPYHSPLMEPLKPELVESLQGINPQPPTIPLFSTVLGQAVAGSELDAGYWAQNMRNPVLFAPAINELIQADYNLFLEISAHPVLASSISECLTQLGKKGTVLPSLRRKEPERVVMLGSLGKLYTLGYPVDWNQLYPEAGHLVRLPSYPWQRERYWQESEASQQARLGQPFRRAMLSTQVHPLLGYSMNSAQPMWDGSIDTQQLTYLNDHRVQGAVVYPGAAYVEMALATAKETFRQESCVVEEIKFQKALFLPDNDPPTLQLILDPNEKSFDIYSRAKDSEKSWLRHATGKLIHHQNNNVPKPVNLDEIRNRCTNEIAKRDCYEQFQEIGLQYGPYFQGIEQLLCGEGESLGQLRVSESLETDLENYWLHPTILDASFQVLLGTVFFKPMDNGKAPSVYLPVQIDRVCFYTRPGIHLWSHARLVEQSATHLKADIQLLDQAGNVLVDIQGLQCQSLAAGQKSVSEPIEDHLYEYQWQLKPCPGQVILLESATYLPSCRQISQSLQAETARLSERLGRTHYYETVEPQFEGLCTDYVLKALQQLGWQPQLCDRISTDALAQQLGVTFEHQRLLGRMLEMLQEEGVLIQVEDQWQVCQIPDLPEPQETWNTMLAKFPAYQAELMLLGRCGANLAQVLRGEVDPLQLIFAEGSLTTSEHLYQDSPSYRIYNLLVQKAIAKALEHLPEGRKVRILEIGAGTGSMTSYVLPKLPANRTEYVFTDVSQRFTASAEQKFRDYPFVEYKRLDIEADPLAQGFDAHSFDLILASDVLHATHNLRQTLENVKQILASAGQLVVLELTHAPRWFDLVFGMLKGWWLFGDVDLRPKNPLLSAQQWGDLLAEVGFSEVASLCDTTSNDESLHTVILAHGPEVQPATPPELAAPPQPEKPGTWLIFTDSFGVGQQLADRMKAQNDTPILISPGMSFQRIDAHHFQIRPEHPEDIQQLLKATLADCPAYRGVVHLWSLDIPPGAATTVSSLKSAQRLGSFSVLHLVQALVNGTQSESPRLWLVTRGVQAVEGSCQSVAVDQSPLWGLGRVINNEYPNLRCTKVDISGASSPEEIQSLLTELYTDDQEDEIVLRGKARYVNRLTRVSPAEVGTVHDNSQPFRLAISTPGVLDSLKLQAMSRQTPGQGEVEIQVCAMGLNFKDVTKAMNLLGDTNVEDNVSGQGLGLECAGIITALGEGVEGFDIGDEVIAFAPDSFGSYAITEAHWVVHKPRSLSFEEAATIPLAFLTAYYALHNLGRLDKSDRILIHAAATGVGLAAVQIAQQVGAEIFATAGNPEKREFLRSLGVQHVMDSRSLAFTDEVIECTGGKGVDLVLNSLAGETIPKSLSVLAAYGRFIDIGKWHSNTSQSGLKPVGNNLSLFTVDIAQILRDRPDFARSLFCQVGQLFADGTFHPLPHRVFPISKVRTACRYMAEAKHIGKFVISWQDPEVVVAPSSDETVTFCADATYLITGGLGGFSLAVAQWLVERGAKHLVLMGRRGAASPKAKSAVKTLEEAGAHVVIAKADVTDQKQVAKILADIHQSMPPLLGIIHAAMVLDDALLPQLNEERMQNVMAPKIVGAWNLHSQTLNIPLDFFILFSSLASTVGNPGQGNYVAANAFLEALVNHRRVQGLPALTVNWGAVTDVGYVAQNTEIGQHLNRIGVKQLPSQQGLKMLGLLLQQQAVQVAIAPVDWHKWSKLHAAGSLPRFSPVVGEAVSEQSQADDLNTEEDSLINSILAVEPAERQPLLVSCIGEQVAKVLLTCAHKLDIEQPLTALGLDSLMAVELSNRIKNELGVDVPTVKLIQGPSIAQLATQVSEQLTPDRATSSASLITSNLSESNATQNGAPTEEASQILAKLDQLADTEIDALLNSVLSNTQLPTNG